jgi:RNA polymerase sigma-70 factor (ECF subfamily)
MVTAVATHLPETWKSPAEAECLVDRAKRGERAAFLALFQSHARCVYTLSLRATRNVTAAENLTRDTFVEAFSNLDAVGDDEAFATLLHGYIATKIIAKRALAG